MYWWKCFSCIFYYLFDKCVYLYSKMYLLIVLFIIWLIIKINMDESAILNELSLLCTNILVFTWFCNCKFPIKKIGKCYLSNRVDIQMCIRIWDNRFVFVFENIRIRIHISVKCDKKWYPNPIPCVSDPFPSVDMIT
jgi:hypothetical protein